MSETAQAPEPAKGRCLPRSCYLVEYSVLPGGARLGDIYVGTTLGELRDALWEHPWAPEAAPDLIMGYGALLHLWVVQDGAIVEGIDLHPYLRTGDARCDVTLQWVIDNLGDHENDRWVDVSLVMEYGEDGYASMLPLMTRILDLHDRMDADGDPAAEAELDDIREAVERRQPPDGGVTIDGLRIDWEAIVEVAPALREPLLDTDWVSVRWAEPGRRPGESHLHEYTEPTEPEALHVGWNTRESPDDFGPPPPIEG